MQKHLFEMLGIVGSSFNWKVERILGFYTLMLMFRSKSYDYGEVAALCDRDKSSVARALASKKTNGLVSVYLNRAARRALAAAMRKNPDEIFTIVDSTFISRTGQGVQNAQKYKSSKGWSYGHRFTNIILLVGDLIIPIATLPHYTTRYCEEMGISDQKTEAEAVVAWIQSLIATKAQDCAIVTAIRRSTFLLDSGYDSKKIQRAIRRLGSKFISAVKSNRKIDGSPINQYFKRHRCISWETVRLLHGHGGKGSRREFSVRHANGVGRAGFGEVVAVCSEKRRDNTKVRRFFVSSDTTLSARAIVSRYRRRWAIETWHRTMKQNHGYASCKASTFACVENHVRLAMTAFLVQSLLPEVFGKSGTSLATVVTSLAMEGVVLELNRFGSKAKLEATVQAAVRQAMPLSA